jgi:hypothetical protein
VAIVALVRTWDHVIAYWKPGRTEGNYHQEELPESVATGYSFCTNENSTTKALYGAYLIAGLVSLLLRSTPN